MKPSVYLIGPITGASYEGCTDWREYVANDLTDNGIIPWSPMRHKDYLLGKTTVDDSYEDKVMSSQRGIFARDTFDCRNCTAGFVNFLDTERISIGSVMEIAWLHAYQKVCVLVMKPGDRHDHAMLREACPFIVGSIDEGVDVLKRILLP